MNQFLFGTPWPWWPILLSGAGAGVLTWRGYKYRAAELKPQALKLLSFLRFAGWALLFLCLLQPMSRQFTNEKKSSRLTLLVDDSESMSFADGRDGISRMERVKTVLGGAPALKPVTEGSPAYDNQALLGVLSRSFTVQLESFSGTAHTISTLQELKAAGESTDIARALTESHARLKGPDAGGLVLVTDGADTARGDLERIVSTYKRSGIPIYVLGIGEPHMEDLAILQVRCRRTVSKDTLVHVEVDVRKQGVADGKQSVYITRKGKRVGDKFELDMKGDTGTATFDFLPDDQGFLEYQATVEPFPGELVTANNTMAFGLVAYSRKLKVLYAEGSIYVHRTYNSQSHGMYYNHPMQYWWETEFLQRALQEDSDVEVDVLAKDPFQSPREASPLDIKSVKEGGWPKTKKDLYQYDVVISSDIPYGYFTPDQVQAQVDFVSKHGGGFCMVGGYTAFAEGKYAKTPIDRMLPVEMLDELHIDGIDFNWQITEKGYEHEIFRLESDPEKNREAWAKLPQFHGFNRTTRAKPAAEVLAEVADETYNTYMGPAVIVAVQPFGNGRSMAFTTDTTGGWGTEWEDTWGPDGADDLDTRNKYYKTFWKNAIRWLAHYRMQAPNQLVQIESDRLVYGRGEQPEIRVKVMNEDYDLTHDAKVQLTVNAPDGRTQQVSIFPNYEEPGIYERKLELPLTGRYEIEAIANLGKEELGRDRTILQVRPATVEMRELSQNVPLLKKLASETGGVYLPIENASELPRHLREATHVIEKHRDNDLWDTPVIFLLIISLLCGEWYLRKRSGLP